LELESIDKDDSLHNIAESLGENKSVTLTGFHALSGSDTTSSSASCGKTKAWRPWLMCESAIDAFFVLSHPVEDIVGKLEQYTTIMYDAELAGVNINEARKTLFTSKGRTLDRIPCHQHQQTRFALPIKLVISGDKQYTLFW